MYLSHFHRLRQWIQKRVQIIKLSQKVNTKFQKSLKLRLLRCVRVRRLLVAYAGADTSTPKKIYRSALVPKYAKAFSTIRWPGQPRRPMGSAAPGLPYGHH